MRTWSSAIALGIVALVGVFALRHHGQERRLASRAEAFVDRAGRQVGELASLAERPPHDFSRDRQAIRAQLARISDELQLRERPDSLPRARFELGRLYAALGDAHTALAHFDRAHALGFDDPRLGHARGLALAELDRRARIRVKRLPPSPTRRALLERVEGRLGRPALEEIEAAIGGLGGQRPWAELHIAFLRGDHRAVLDGIEQIGASAEARRLQGRALERLDDRTAAARAFEEALDLAPSHGGLHLDACALWLDALGAGLDDPGDGEAQPPAGCTAGATTGPPNPRRRRPSSDPDNLPAHRARAEVLCGDGLRLDPESFGLRAALAALHRDWARHALLHASATGPDPAPSLDALDLLLAPISERGTIPELLGEPIAPSINEPGPGQHASEFALATARVLLYHLRADARRLRAELRGRAEGEGEGEGGDVDDLFEEARSWLERAAQESAVIEGPPFALDEAQLDLSIAAWEHARGGVGDPVPWLESARRKLETLEASSPEAPTKASENGVDSGADDRASPPEASPGGASIELEIERLRARIRALR